MNTPDAAVADPTAQATGREDRRSVRRVAHSPLKAIMRLMVVSTVVLGASCTRVSRDRQVVLSGTTHMDSDGTLIRRRDPLFGTPPAKYFRKDLDINSGDFRYHDDSGGSVETTICESRLSREARRLGISLPTTRNWQIMYLDTHGQGLHIQYAYPHVVESADRLLDILAGVVETDDERRVFLERFMASLRTGDPFVVGREAHLLWLAIADEHGMSTPFHPEIEADLRQSLRRKGTSP